MTAPSPSSLLLPRRRTQADRSAATRAKILEATVMLLQTQGYAATTIQRISKTANVSLGALQHHFPTKSQVMATVLRHYALKRARLYRRALSMQATPEQRVDAMLDTMWRLVTDGPEFLATVEIELARRSDPDLEAVTAPVLERIDQFMTRWLSGQRMAPPDPRFVELRLLNSALLRGLAVERARGVPVENLARSFEVWRQFSRTEFLRIAARPA
ncbi:TetR family transcriptional regulator [Gluconobacter oxydans]|uniref:TetR/AcrR family transcriptional regulator n=2 Tax=Gluconobacter thailandicus TaxID=257438 RepID=A0AAP9JHC8_GLUTH|nr:TetR/AcrR family transcriptional regulator [Gluconobacter thailandicus]AFW00378.1 TetR family transcriptional regulator [Gluconobacter oxydans H24]ANQ40871.1 TetR family transcriptional regulator [Gluconobacter oxydans]KXV54843.1 TetR family transcriptional regulator [Gluconobacter thailandicus]QEH96063.1 TetR/AcrR family transcriptional regulator [Gluconobacter thailandicus]GAC88300.1 TetR family transcriptional regulator [Gluconobacter thailandicus NBRC 3255]